MLANLPTPATTLSSGGESDSEGVKESSGSAPNLVSDASEGVRFPGLILGSTSGAASLSGGSGDEGGGGPGGGAGGGGGGGGGKRETKRKLFDALEEYAPKRRSSRVC